MAKPGPKGPSKYDPKLCQELVDFFDVEPYEELEVKNHDKNGKEWFTYELRPNDLPHLSGFAKKIGVNTCTLSDWANKYPEFSDALKRAKELNEQMLTVNALRGLYNSTFSIFTAKNKFGWRDEQHLKTEQKDEKQITVKIVSELTTEELRALIGHSSGRALPAGTP